MDSCGKQDARDPNRIINGCQAVGSDSEKIGGGREEVASVNAPEANRKTHAP